MRPTREYNGASDPCLPVWPCSGWGLHGPVGYPSGRWSLTPPFHPYRPPWREAVILCCTFRRITPPSRYEAPRFVEPGLSSSRCAATGRGHLSTGWRFPSVSVLMIQKQYQQHTLSSRSAAFPAAFYPVSNVTHFRPPTKTKSRPFFFAHRREYVSVRNLFGDKRIYPPWP